MLRKSLYQFIALACLFLAGSTIHAQPGSPVLSSNSPSYFLPADTNEVLAEISLDEYLLLVVRNHPAAKQARLLDELAQAELTGVRGAFDPKVAAGYNHKQFDDKEYFQYVDTELKIATASPVDFIAAYNLTDGLYYNPELLTPDQGLVQLGLEAKLGRGLMIDRRRADLAIARLMVEENAFARQLILNDLYAAAATAYWDWAEAQAKVQIYQQTLALARDRFVSVRASYFNGDEPAIDTLEAYIQLEQRVVDLNESRIKLQKTANMALAFLWDEDGSPIEADLQNTPVSLEAVDLGIRIGSDWNENLDEVHPDLLRYDIKREQAQVDQRFAREQLKPDLTVKYLHQSTAPGAEPFAPSIGDQKILVGFAMPLFMRKARAQVQKADIKLRDIGFAQEGKQRLIEAKARALFAELDLLGGQIRSQRQIVRDRRRLYDAENLKFRIGESSVFVLQSRENSLIKAQLDLAGLLANYPRVEVELLRVLGRAYVEQDLD